MRAALLIFLSFILFPEASCQAQKIIEHFYSPEASAKNPTDITITVDRSLYVLCDGNCNIVIAALDLNALQLFYSLTCTSSVCLVWQLDPKHEAFGSSALIRISRNCDDCSFSVRSSYSLVYQKIDPSSISVQSAVGIFDLVFFVAEGEQNMRSFSVQPIAPSFNDVNIYLHAKLETIDSDWNSNSIKQEVIAHQNGLFLQVDLKSKHFTEVKLEGQNAQMLVPIKVHISSHNMEGIELKDIEKFSLVSDFKDYQHAIIPVWTSKQETTIDIGTLNLTENEPDISTHTFKINFGPDLNLKLQVRDSNQEVLESVPITHDYNSSYFIGVKKSDINYLRPKNLKMQLVISQVTRPSKFQVIRQEDVWDLNDHSAKIFMITFSDTLATFNFHKGLKTFFYPGLLDIKGLLTPSISGSNKTPRSSKVFMALKENTRSESNSTDFLTAVSNLKENPNTTVIVSENNQALSFDQEKTDQDSKTFFELGVALDGSEKGVASSVVLKLELEEHRFMMIRPGNNFSQITESSKFFVHDRPRQSNPNDTVNPYFIDLLAVSNGCVGSLIFKFYNNQNGMISTNGTEPSPINIRLDEFEREIVMYHQALSVSSSISIWVELEVTSTD